MINSQNQLLLTAWTELKEKILTKFYRQSFELDLFHSQIIAKIKGLTVISREAKNELIVEEVEKISQEFKQIKQQVEKVKRAYGLIKNPEEEMCDLCWAKCRKWEDL